MVSNNRVAFGTWLAQQLAHHDMSQADFARIAGFPSSTISQLISGKRHPSARTAERIADGLRIDTTDVLRAAGLLGEPGEDSAEIRAIRRRLQDVELRPERHDLLITILDRWLELDRAKHPRPRVEP